MRITSGTGSIMPRYIETWRKKGSSYGRAHQGHLKPGLIEPEYGRILTSARKAREASDYADRLELDEEAARRIVADADRFVARMEEYLTNAGVL